MVAGHRQTRNVQRRQLGEEPVKQGDCLSRRHGPVIDVTGQQHGLRPLLRRRSTHLFQYIPLIAEHGKTVDILSNMQVTQMKKFHPSPSFIGCKKPHPQSGGATLAQMLSGENHRQQLRLLASAIFRTVYTTVRGKDSVSSL